jgi:exodeoxyribonuclease V alpha subunit
MVKHVSIRFAWHDDKWDGGICKDPERNIYCTGNYSLLSPRLQRRIEIETEVCYKDQEISKPKKERNYVPPCYWCLNALGKERYEVEEEHPFSDAGRMSNEFRTVPSLRYDLDGFSVFSWNFKLGYAQKGSYQRYVPPEELKTRTSDYLGEIENGKSIAFFYANYSNPITADDYKYLLLGAGLVKDTREPQEYEIPGKLVERIRSQDRMENFPKTAWQFQILLEPDTVFVFPYNEYLDLIGKNQPDPTEQWKQLDQIAVRIEEKNIIPHFKYVSMHLPHDKAIYLLYLMRQAVRQMREQEIVKFSLLAEIESKISKLLAHAWKERGRYPGFCNAMFLALKNDFDKQHLKKLIPRIRKNIMESFGSIEVFFEKAQDSTSQSGLSGDITKSLRILNKNKEYLRFLSMFDFSIKQFENVQKIVDRLGAETLKKNPYLILENYHYDFYDTWNIEESDYGIGLYQIDIPLIPDPSYVDWEALHDARSQERLRALVSKILYDVASEDGSSYCTRSDIIERIQKYPLYYINEKLQVDVNLLADYEKQMIFKEKFIIISDIRENEVSYQLRALKDIENIIEQFVGKMLKKTHKIEPTQAEEIIEKELLASKGKKLDIIEKRNLYNGCLANGLFIISGKAGSGKTQGVANLIADFFNTRTLPVFVFTPTGKANLVVRKRLKDLKLHRENKIRVSTIHRFLYRALSDYYMQYTMRRGDISQLEELISELLDGKLERLNEFRSLARNWSFNPKVVIIDEASMVDEVLLAVLFSMINAEALEYLILVGDERQLPPIGVGRPFVDIIYYLKQKGLEEHYIHLESNLRFDQTKNIGKLSELFSGQEEPSPIDIDEALKSPDESLEVHYFSDASELKGITTNILGSIGCPSTGKPLFEMFADTFETEGELNLDKVQIITPRRIGDFGSMAINQKIILNGKIEYGPRTKLICEENMYFNARKGGRVLGLANGSIGYIVGYGNFYFDDIPELIEDYGFDSVERGLLRQVRAEVYSSAKTERKIDLGYAITVHKAQGSDFEHVILAFSQMSPFITRELLYTALTRPKEKLHFLVHSDLKENLAQVLMKVYSNSLVEQRKTLLFGHKFSPFKPYQLTLRNGRTIQVDSKIERIIAQVLDGLGVDFEAGPKEFYAEHHMVPDFKLHVNDKIYYLEHLGNMGNLSYRERWLRKFPVYQKLGLVDRLITTSEGEEKTNIEENIKKIIADLKSGRLQKTEDYSEHHYEI